MSVVVRLDARWCKVCGMVLYARECVHGNKAPHAWRAPIRPCATVPLPMWHPLYPFRFPADVSRDAAWAAPAGGLQEISALA